MRRAISWLLNQTFLLILIVTAIGCLLSLLSLLSGCTPTGAIATQSSTSVYKYDLSGTVNGRPFQGVGVFPSSTSYDIRIQSMSTVDAFTFTSCHRDFQAYAVITQGWFVTNKAYDYVYSPAIGLEDSGSCLVRVGSYSKSVGGQNGWAIIDFDTPDAVLPSENVCNGVDGYTNGVSMCQTRAGLIEQLKFKSAVHVAADKLDPKCVGRLSTDGMTWTYTAALGECVIEFMEVAKPHRKHRHTTVGFNQIMIPGD